MHIHNPWIMKKSSTFHIYCDIQFFLRVAYTYSDCSREAYVSTREELHFQQGVLFLIKILDFYYMLCPRRTGDSLGRIKTHVCDSFYLTVMFDMCWNGVDQKVEDAKDTRLLRFPSLGLRY